MLLQPPLDFNAHHAQGAKALYAEGLAIHPTGAHPHSWVVMNGQVVDPTWPDAYMATYFGIAFDPEWALITMREKDNWIGFTTSWDLYEPSVREKLSAQTLGDSS